MDPAMGSFTHFFLDFKTLVKNLRDGFFGVIIFIVIWLVLFIGNLRMLLHFNNAII